MNGPVNPAILFLGNVTINIIKLNKIIYKNGVEKLFKN